MYFSLSHKPCTIAKKRFPSRYVHAALPLRSLVTASLNPFPTIWAWFEIDPPDFPRAKLNLLHLEARHEQMKYRRSWRCANYAAPHGEFRQCDRPSRHDKPSCMGKGTA